MINTPRSFHMIVAATALVGLSALAWSSTALGATPANTVTPNLIRDPGAESAKPSDGNKVPVPGWVVGASSNFTAVSYGTSGGFPTLTSPGPKHPGRNFSPVVPRATSPPAARSTRSQPRPG